MKTTFIIVSTIVLTSFTFPRPDMSMDDKLQMINQKICQPLKLNNEKTEKVKACFKAFFTEIDEITPRGHRPDRNKAHALAAIRDKKIKQILTEAQYKKYLKLEPETRPEE